MSGDIKITPHMVSVGVGLLEAHRESYADEHLVAAIYEAMLRAGVEESMVILSEEARLE